MDTAKRLFLVAFLANMLLGCVTSRLFDDKHYREVVNSVLISQDQKNLVVMTTKYHYIFEAEPGLIKTLTSTLHKRVTGYLSNFSVSPEGKTTGSYSLVLNNPSEAESQTAEDFGYSRDKQSEYLILSGNLVGQRFDSSGIQVNSESTSLNSTYFVEVFEKQSTQDKSANALKTPITLALDGALILVAVPLIVIPYGDFFLMCMTSQCGK